jgi:YVTN family beta-propeller protein
MRPFSFPHRRVHAVFRPAGILLAVFAAATLHAEAPNSNAGSFLLVANKGDRTLSLVDPVAEQEIATVAEDGVTGHEVAASLDGRRAFVPIYGSGGVGTPGTDGSVIRVIDLGTRQLAGAIEFGKGVRPHCAVLCPADGLLYVTTELENDVTIINPKTLKIVGKVPTGTPESHMLAITRNGHYGYTANVASGTISVLDLKKRKLVKLILVSSKIQRIALSADDRKLFTADQAQPRIAVIDTRKGEVSGWVALPGSGYGMAATKNGRWLVVALNGLNQVAIIDLHTMKLAQTLDVPRSPQEILIRPDDQVAYASCDASKQVAVIDLQATKVEKLINVGGGADGLAWASAR